MKTNFKNEIETKFSKWMKSLEKVEEYQRKNAGRYYKEDDKYIYLINDLYLNRYVFESAVYDLELSLIELIKSKCLKS